MREQPVQGPWGRSGLGSWQGAVSLGVGGVGSAAGPSLSDQGCRLRSFCVGLDTGGA